MSRLNRRFLDWHNLAAALGRIVLVAPLALSLLSGAGLSASRGHAAPEDSGALASTEVAAATGTELAARCGNSDTAAGVSSGRDGGTALDTRDGPAATAILREAAGQQPALESRKGAAPSLAAVGHPGLAPARFTLPHAPVRAGDVLRAGFGAAAEGRAVSPFSARAPPIPSVTI